MANSQNKEPEESTALVFQRHLFATEHDSDELFFCNHDLPVDSIQEVLKHD